MELFGFYPDFLMFIQGVSFLVLAVAAFLMTKRISEGLSWPSLTIFALLFSFSTLGRLTFSILWPSLSVHFFADAIALTAFFFLGEFVRRSPGFRSRRRPKRWLWLFPVAAVLVIVILQRPLNWHSVIYSGVGTTLALGASASFFMEAQKQKIVQRKWFTAAGGAFLLMSLSFGITMFSGVNLYPFLLNICLSQSLPDMISSGLPGAAALVVAFALTRMSIAGAGLTQMPSYLRRKANIHYFLSISVLLIIIVGGWLLTNYVGRTLIDNIHRRTHLDAQLVSEHLGGTFGQTNRLIMSLSSMHSISAALANPTENALRDAGYDLTQVRRSYLLEKAILIDREGNIVAGHDLLETVPAPLDITNPVISDVLLGTRRADIVYDRSREIPLYVASFPVRLQNGEIAGAIILEKNIEGLELFLRKYPWAFHLSPEGMIIMASRTYLRHRPMWPLTAASRAAVSTRMGYPAILGEPLLSHKPTGRLVLFNAYPHLLARSFHAWPIHILTPLTSLVQGRLLAMLPLFLLIVFTLIFFIDSTQLFAKSSQALGAERRFQIIFNSVPSAIFILDGQSGEIIQNNEYVYRWLGYSPGEMRKLSLSDLIVEPSENQTQLSYRTKAGVLRDVDELTADILIDDRPSKLVIVHDITELKNTLDELRLAREFSDSVLDIAAAMIIVLDRQGKIVLFNNHAQQVTGWTSHEVVGLNWFDVFNSDKEKFSPPEVIDNSLTGQSPREYESFILTKQGANRLISWKDTVLKDSSGAVLMLIATGIDITEQRQNEDNLTRLSLIDSLTGIANRRSFDDFFGRQWKLAAREGKSISLILGDIDFFKNYNDTLGHPAGDSCLAKIAEIMQGTIRRPFDLVARYGGEEFAVVLPDTDSNGAFRVASEIREKLAASKLPHPASSKGEYVTISLGVASALPGPGITADALLTAADQALYQAKTNGRDRIEQAEPL